MKTLIPALDRFLYFPDSKFTIKLLTTESHARKRKQSKNNNTKKQQQPKKKDQHPQKTMAIDQAFGERGGISPIRFISFPAALTFPFAHSNWQNKIPVWLSSLSSAPGNHSSAAPYIQTPPNPPLFCHLSSAASSWQHIKHKHNACPLFWLKFKEEACRWASLQSEVTCANHLGEGRISAFHFPPITTSCFSLPLCTSLALPAYLNNSSEVQPSRGITISVSLPGYRLAAHTESPSAIYFI